MSPGRLAALATALAAAMLLVCAGAVASCGPLAGWMAAACPPEQQPTGGDNGDCDPSVVERWDAEQVANAAIIVGVGADLQVPIWGRVIAVAVAMQESSLRNLPHLGQRNDHDSIGLFQQRPSQGWGTQQQLQDPEYTATAFYQALLKVDGWLEMPLAQAGQAVQRSAHPDAYTRWASDAAMLVAILSADEYAGWTRPLHGRLVSGFGARGGRLHTGVDIAAPRGTIIVAASAGIVAAVACNAWHVDGSWWGCDRDGDPHLTQGCGWYTDLIHADSVLTRYCHLDTRPWVEVGQQVTAGQPIGPVGTTGNSTGPHLHYEVRLRDDTGAWVPVDPIMWMRQVGAPLG